MAMAYVDLYSTLMNGIGDALQSALASIWFATEADLLGWGAIVIASFVLAWALLTWAALNTPEAKAEAKDEHDRLRVWTLILAGVNVTALSKACPPPATSAVAGEETTKGADADADADADAGTMGDPGRAA